MKNKRLSLQEIIENYQKLAVAFSGGVDSTFLLKVAHDVLGDNVMAVTVKSCLIPAHELKEAIDFCKEFNIRQSILEFDPFQVDGFCHNPKNRCYLCKKSLFSKIIAEAAQRQISVIAEGSNVDDRGDYRPGMQAIAELGVKSPLLDAGLTKKEIRELSHQLGLKTWSKPSFACLASRFVYGDTITKDKLSMVERAEQVLSELGFVQYRVRVHDNMARIEVLPDDFDKVLKCRNEILIRLKSLGFSYISLDLQGYRTGSMNEVL